MKKVVLMAVVVIGIALFSISMGHVLVEYRDKWKIGKIEEKISSEITRVDVTDLIVGEDVEHEHVYKSNYDSNKHWEECKICSKKRNEISHKYVDNGWSLGSSCSELNLHKFSCSCGYFYTSSAGKNSHTYKVENNLADYRKQTVCKVCNTGTLEPCYKQDGSRIKCNNLGKCVKCNYTYTESRHNININYENIENMELRCKVCNKYLGNLNFARVIKNSNTSYKLEVSVTVANGMKYTGMYENTSFGSDVTLSPTKTSFNGNTWVLWRNFTISNYREKGGNVQETFLCDYNGQPVNIDLHAVVNKLDEIEPTINSVGVDNSKWGMIKQIIVSGTENYCKSVAVKIVDGNEKVLFEGSGSVTNGAYSISCVPELEAGVEGKIFKVIVTDAFENKTEKEFTISKIDSIAPEIISGNKVADGWAKLKQFTFNATDKGIGNVSIAFNDISDLKLASFDGEKYFRNYEFVGDVYSPKELSVLYKDELGNTSMQKITIDKIDNTGPTITSGSIHNSVLTVVAHDRHETLGEGSGIVKYRYIASKEKIDNPVISSDNGIEVGVNDKIVIDNILDVKYVYVVAEDLVRKCE